MLRRASAICLLVAIFDVPAHAQGTRLMPGVTYEKTVEFTPHGAVVIHVLPAPRPGDQNGLYQLAPVLAKGAVLGGKQRVTQLEKDVSNQMTVAGINGDLFSATDGHPAGIFMQGGLPLHPPLSTRSSIGVDSAAALHVDRVKFFGTSRGTGQRRPLSVINDTPTAVQGMLFTPAFCSRPPVDPGAAEILPLPF